MTLDIERYRTEVLRPMRLRPDAMPASSSARYGLFESLTGADLEAHLAEVRRYWSVVGGGVGTLAEACRILAETDVADPFGQFDEPVTATPDPEPVPDPEPIPPVEADPEPVPDPEPITSVEADPDPEPARTPPQVVDARAEWFSDHLRVSWSWPEGVRWVRVTVVPGQRTTGQIVSALSAVERSADQLPPEVETRTLSMNQYAAAGGCVLPWEGPPGKAQIRSLQRGPDFDLISDPVEVGLESPSTVVTWEADRPRRFAPRDRQRRWTVRGTVDGDGAGAELELAVVAQSGTVVAPRLRQPDIIARHRVGGALGEFAFEVLAPPELGRHYTLRCFVIGDRAIDVVDPPFTSLKV